MAVRVSRKELAQRYGITTQAIDKLVKDGRLTPGADKKFDLDEADRVRSEQSARHIEKEQLQKDIGGQGAGGVQHPLTQARTMEAVYRAKSRELAFQREKGALVERKAVEADGFEIGRILQQRVLAWPARMAAELSTLVALPDAERYEAVRKCLDREAKLLVGEIADEISRV